MVDPDPIAFLELLGSVIFKMAGIVNVNELEHLIRII